MIIRATKFYQEVQFEKKMHQKSAKPLVLERIAVLKKFALLEGNN